MISRYKLFSPKVKRVYTGLYKHIGASLNVSDE